MIVGINEKDRVLLLLSGGLDSVTCLLELLNIIDKQNLTAISFIYDFQNKEAIECAKKVCCDFKINHEIIDLSVLSELSSKKIVYGRNLFFIYSAALYAKYHNQNKIIIALVKDGINSYNDCKPEFITYLNAFLKFTFEYDLELLAPYIQNSKVDIFKFADEMGRLQYVYNNSNSCWKNQKEHCGECTSCKVREASYNEYNKSKYHKSDLEGN